MVDEAEQVNRTGDVTTDSCNFELRDVLQRFRALWN